MNIFTSFDEFEVFEMASTLSKLNVPNKLITAIHRLTKEKNLNPITYASNIELSRYQWDTPEEIDSKTHITSTAKTIIKKIMKGEKLTASEEAIVERVQSTAASEGFNSLTESEKAILIALNYQPYPGRLPHDIKVMDPVEVYPDIANDPTITVKEDENGNKYMLIGKTRLFGNMYKTGAGKKPGFLADLSKTPWGSMRMLIVSPDGDRYDYVYFKGRSSFNRDARGGKKYRVVTMDGNGDIKRDWMAYQGKRLIRDESGEREVYRDDFKNYPAGGKKKIKVYLLDISDTSAEEKFKKRKSLREVTMEKLYEDFLNRYGNILTKMIQSRGFVSLKKDRIEKSLSDMQFFIRTVLKLLNEFKDRNIGMPMSTEQFRELSKMVDEHYIKNYRRASELNSVIDEIGSYEKFLRILASYILTDDLDKSIKNSKSFVSSFEEVDQEELEDLGEEPEEDSLGGAEEDDEEDDEEDWI